MEHSVYLITNLDNGKYYVGKTSKPSLSKYLRDAFSNAMKGRNNRPFLHRALRKYGLGTFVIESLTSCDTNEQAILFERAWIASLDARNHAVGYNLSEGGEGSPGIEVSAATRLKLSIVNRGRRPWNKGRSYHNQSPSKQTGENNSFFGKSHSQETKDAVSSSNSKRIWTLEMRAKMSATKKKFHHSIETLDKMKIKSSSRIRGEGGRFAKN